MRRSRPEKRVISPDLRYQSVTVQNFINRIMKSGKKSLATRLMYETMEIVQERTGRDPIEVLETAMKNVGPMMIVLPRRVGGATYQVPIEATPARRQTLAMRWILTAARSRTGRSFSDKLSSELMDAAKNQGSAVKKREESHKMAEANRAFSHYRL